MPSPLAHAVAGATVGWSVVPAFAGRGAQPWREGLLFAGLAVAPDLDLLVGAHSGPTHSLGAALVVALAVAALSRTGRLGLAAGLAYASHILLDWLGSDSSPPIGIMALWPIAGGHYESDLHLFHAISRRYWLPGFWAHNARAVAWELLILAPLAALVWAIKAHRGWGKEPERASSTRQRRSRAL